MVAKTKETEAGAAEVAAPQGGELATTGETALAGVPEHILANRGQGTEHFTPEMLRIPRLALAHGTTPQMVKSDANYIPELKLGDAFNDLTGEIYGDGPLEVIFVRSDKPRWMELDEDRNIVDRNVPAGDPRTEWRVDPENPKKSLQPIATMFLDYVILLGPQLEPMALSFKRTGVSTALRLNSLLNMPKKYKGQIVGKVAIYNQKYILKSSEDSDDKNTWYNFSVRANGLVEDPELAAKAKKAFEQFAIGGQKAHVVEFDDADVPAGREPGSDDDQM